MALSRPQISDITLIRLHRIQIKLLNANKPRMSNSEIIEWAVQELYENWPLKGGDKT